VQVGTAIVLQYSNCQVCHFDSLTIVLNLNLTIYVYHCLQKTILSGDLFCICTEYILWYVDVFYNIANKIIDFTLRIVIGRSFNFFLKILHILLNYWYLIIIIINLYYILLLLLTKIKLSTTVFFFKLHCVLLGIVYKVHNKILKYT